MLLLVSLCLAFLQVHCNGFVQVSSSRSPEICLNLTPSPSLEKFVDILPDIPTISLLRYPVITIGAYKIIQKLHRDLRPTTLYAFGTSRDTAMYPGPTLVAEQGTRAGVRWENHIPDHEHMLPVDHSLHWANPRRGYVPITVHNHGQEDEGWADGHPNSWFTITGEHGSTYVTQNYVYPNDQLPTMLWYHDHTFGITRLNIAAGMVGVYLIHSRELEPAWVPKAYRVLVIQDKAFYEDGSIKYPTVGINPDVHPVWCPDYFGDVVLVNGKAWPYMNVEPAVYRFRMVNAANSRTFVLVLSKSSLRFIKIGTDQSYLHTPIKQKQMRVMPAERVDWLIDFSDCNYGDEIEIRNIGNAPFPTGPAANQSVLLFKVVSNAADKGFHDVQIPNPLTPKELRKLSPVDIIYRTAGVDLSHVDWSTIYNRPLQQEVELDSGGNLITLFQHDRLHFDDPAQEIIRLYSKELWAFINLDAVSAHAMHPHLVSSIVLTQQPFNASRYINGKCSFEYNYPDPRSCYTDLPLPPDEDQVGLKDTALALPFFVTRFYIEFRSNLLPRYHIDPTKFPGYIHHCHLLEHKDNEMMRPMLMTHKMTYYPNASFPLLDVWFLTAPNKTDYNKTRTGKVYSLSN